MKPYTLPILDDGCTDDACPRCRLIVYVEQAETTYITPLPPRLETICRLRHELEWPWTTDGKMIHLTVEKYVGLNILDTPRCTSFARNIPVMETP